MDTNLKKQPPTEAGLYWAKSGTYKWFNLIVEIYGESPFFKIRAWCRPKDQIINISHTDIAEWGDKIVEPE